MRMRKPPPTTAIFARTSVPSVLDESPVSGKFEAHRFNLRKMKQFHGEEGK